MKSPIKPLDGWIVVEHLQSDEMTTSSGIVLAGRDPEKTKNMGKVIATPKDSPVAEGCTIYFKSYAFIECWVEEKKYLLMEYQDIVGVRTE